MTSSRFRNQGLISKMEHDGTYSRFISGFTRSHAGEEPTYNCSKKHITPSPKLFVDIWLVNGVGGCLLV